MNCPSTSTGVVRLDGLPVVAEISESRTVGDCCSSLSTLTLDVDQSSVLKKTAPRFRQLLVRYANERGRLALSRRRWIKRLNGPLLLPDILEFWKHHAISLVPDPARAHRYVRIKSGVIELARRTRCYSESAAEAHLSGTVVNSVK